MTPPVPRTVEGTQGYSAEAPELLTLYERMRFEDSHRGVLDLIPDAGIDVLDIGAGTGRDAAWFAARGDRVTAIEPPREMREGAMALHPTPHRTWIDDSLPDLVSVRGQTFDLAWMSAVWMHFFAAERAAMMPVVTRLVRPGGALMISLRHGPRLKGDGCPSERRRDRSAGERGETSWCNPATFRLSPRLM
jgi:SAM-dependent methyltransferase